VIPLHFLNEEENEKDKNPIENNEEKDVLPIKSLAKSIEEMQISWKTESKLVNVQIESEIESSELSDSSTQSNEETTNHNIGNITQPIYDSLDERLSHSSSENFPSERATIEAENTIDEQYTSEEPTYSHPTYKESFENRQIDEKSDFETTTTFEQKELEQRTPLISVVIVNYNVRDFLQHCLQSLYNSTIHDRMQIVVVDNNSSDNSIEMVKTHFPFVECVELQENIGFGKANNLAIEYCKAPITLLLNPDTIVEPSTLQIMVEYLQNNPNVGVAGCKLLNADGSFQLPCRRGFPTPWVSFCKIFGLQSLFPHSSIFARYNQTFRDENETYTVDAVSGAFMAIRTELLKEVSGFDPDFFMYGEDLDLCYRIQKKGWDIAYVHSTSTIHFKGESTKRSSINEHKHFYEAMEIFASKHIAGSKLFLLFLKLGILLKSFVDLIIQNRTQIITTVLDILLVNSSLLLATKIRMGEFLAFPDFAYPTVFIAFTILLPTIYLFVGVYDKKTPSFTTTMTSYLMLFFFLSSLTYFFKEYAFSRGIMLMTIGGGIVGSFIVRSIGYYQQKIRTKSSTKNTAIIGVTEIGLKIANDLKSTQSLRIEFIGFIRTKKHSYSGVNVDSIIGEVENLPAIIEKHKIQEIVITDETIQISEIMAMMQGSLRRQVRFHISNKLDDLYTDTLINEVSGLENNQYTWNIVLLRNRIIKRLFDIVISFFLLTFGFPVVYLKKNTGVFTVESLKEVLLGRKSIVGIYGNSSNRIAKSGLIGLAHRTNQDIATKKIIDNLNDFYAKQYSLSMDIEILLKFLVQKK
jgi:GT2 family glycosyltransferase